MSNSRESSWYEAEEYKPDLQADYKHVQTNEKAIIIFNWTYLHQIQALHAVLHFLYEFDFLRCLQFCQFHDEMGLLLLDRKVVLLCGLGTRGYRNPTNGLLGSTWATAASYNHN